MLCKTVYFLKYYTNVAVAQYSPPTPQDRGEKRSRADVVPDAAHPQAALGLQRHAHPQGAGAHRQVLAPVG